MGTAGALVGRDTALATLAAAARAAADGRSSFLLVTGDPGVGKTALLAEAARRASDEGARVLWGQCWQAEGTPVYWPWMQVLRTAAGGRVAGTSPALARLLASPGSTADGPPREPVTARFELFDEVVRWLATLADEAPVLVVLDDLHWADEGSCALLAFAARHLHHAAVLLLGAYRDLEASPTLDRLVSQAELLPLDGLDARGVATVMAQVTGTTPDSGLVEQVHVRTGGNPLFVRELTRLLAGHGSLPTDGSPVALRSVQEILERQLSRLTPPCAQMLRAAAVAGRQLRPEVLRRLLPSPEHLSDLLAEAAAARVLAGVPSPPEAYRFRHDLFRETMYATLPPTERGSLHLACGRALEALAQSGAPVHPAEVAGHFVAAFTAGETDAAIEAVDWSRSAACDALAKLAADDARRHYQRALDVLATAPPEAGEDRIDLVLDLGRASDWAGDTTAARTAYREAAELARRRQDAERLAHAAIGVHRLGAPSGMSHAEPIELLEEAARALGGAGLPLRALVLAALARDLHHSWDDDHRVRAAHLAEEAVALARRHHDAGTLARCLLALHDTRWLPGSARSRLGVVNEILILAADTDDHDLRAQALLLRAAARLELGDHRGHDDLTEHCQLAERSGHARGRWQSLSRRATVALIDGDIDTAATLSVRAADLGERIGEPDWSSVADGQLWEVLRFRHERHRFATLGRSGALLASWPPWRALGAIDSGDQETATELLAGFHLDRGFRPGPRTNPEPWSMAIVAEAVAAAGSRTQRETMYRRLTPLAGCHVVTGGCASYSGAFDQYLGLLADALGDTDRARRHFADAVALHEQVGAPAWLALSRAHAERISGVDARRSHPVLRRDGDTWRLTFAGRSTHLPDLKGLHDLAALIDQPGRPVHVTDLVAGAGSDRSAPTPLGADPVLDARAKAAYRSRLSLLESEIDEADRHHDVHRAERARLEREALLGQLSAAVGLGGRDRRLGDDTERARKTVTSRIRGTIARIRLDDTELAEHLEATISTGAWCCYTPPSVPSAASA